MCKPAQTCCLHSQQVSLWSALRIHVLSAAVARQSRSLGALFAIDLKRSTKVTHFKSATE